MISPSMFDKRYIRTNLESAAKRIQASDTSAAQRLNDLAKAVDGGAYADAWAMSDIHQVMNVPLIVQHFRNQPIKDKVVVWVELIRNIFIFAPLVVTWYGISQAVGAYGQLVQADAAQGQLPFILLWQQGFEGRLSGWQSFSAIATADFLILLAVLILTGIGSSLSGLARQRREQEAAELEKGLTHALAGARLCLTTKNWTQPTDFLTRFDQTVETFKKVVMELVGQIKDERAEVEKLALRQTEENKLFSAFKNELRKSMDGIATSVSQLQSSTATLSQSVNTLQGGVATLTGSSNQIATKQDALITSTQQAVDLFNSQVRSQATITQQQEQWGKTLHETLHSLEEILKTSSQQESDFTERLQELHQQYSDYLGKMGSEYASQKELSNHMYQAAESMREVVLKLEEWNNEISGVNVNMHEIARRLAGMAVSKP